MDSNYDENAQLVDRETEELISSNQFMILSIASLGIYPIWWSYKAWRFFRETEGADVIPAARALFNWIFLSSLLERIKDFSIRNGDRPTFSPGLLHLSYFLLVFSAYLPEPYLLITVLNCVVFIQPLKALNSGKINSQEIAAKEQTSFNTRQWVIIVLGSLLWIFSILGIVFGDQPV